MPTSEIWVSLDPVAIVEGATDCAVGRGLPGGTSMVKVNSPAPPPGAVLDDVDAPSIEKRKRRRRTVAT